MGQLEKYGLYVLCLLIFLILGVTIWGSGNLEGPKTNPQVQHLKAGVGDQRGEGVANRGAPNAGTPNGSIPNGGASNGGNSSSGNVRLPNFRQLLTPGPKPSPVANGGPANRGPVNRGPANGGSAANASLGGNQKVAGPKTSKPKPKPKPVTNRPTYTIQRGDTYESIARERFLTRSMVSEIARLNPRLDPLKLRPGLKILMPTKSEADTFLAERAARRTGVKLGNTYKIKKGDTLIGIAKRELGSEKRLRDIQSLNPGVDPASLRIGASLRMPKK